VIDTNVFVSALLSQRGAAFRLMTRVDQGFFQACLSVPLVLEYEDAAKRVLPETRLTETDLDDILNYLCRVSDRRAIHYLWRPYLRDPGDDMVLELAVAAGCDFIITYIKKDFAGIEVFGVQVLSPQEFLHQIG
jgi:putative PIN family toxin of toxin-antitoxin system